jgi:hypothetical protein
MKIKKVRRKKEKNAIFLHTLYIFMKHEFIHMYVLCFYFLSTFVKVFFNLHHMYNSLIILKTRDIFSLCNSKTTRTKTIIIRNAFVILLQKRSILKLRVPLRTHELKN